MSQWGHDFRPEYLRLASAARALGRPPVLALTATAAPPVRADIVERSACATPSSSCAGSTARRSELAVERHHEDERKTRALLDWVVDAPGPGIVYATTQRETEELALALGERGVRSGAVPRRACRRPLREESQEAFMDDGEIDVMVATIAFGMGVDKPDVRFVAHHA